MRLAELSARHGPPLERDAIDDNPDPTWGPVGSLARAHMDPTAYAYLLALHNDMLALERQRKAPAPMPDTHAKPPPPPEPGGPVYIDVTAAT